MLSPTQKENKKSPLSLKNKTLLTHDPTDNNEITKHTEKIKGMSLKKNKGQLVIE